MRLQALKYDLTICKIASAKDMDWTDGFFFLGKTDEEISLVCETNHTPRGTIERDDGWKCFRVEGPLDFSLTGILSGILSLLAARQIGVFAVSTFNTDYILVKKNDFERALRVLSDAGYEIADGKAETP